jgi:hypothetical protein
VQRRAAVGEALQQWSMQQQILRTMNRSTTTTTNCTAFGNTLSCRSF